MLFEEERLLNLLTDQKDEGINNTQRNYTDCLYTYCFFTCQ